MLVLRSDYGKGVIAYKAAFIMYTAGGGGGADDFFKNQHFFHIPP